MVNGRISLRTVQCACALCLVALVPAAAKAEPPEYSIGVSLEHSDNINESSIDPVGQDVLIPRLNFDWNEQGSVLQVRANGQIEYHDYLGGAFDNELRGQLSGIANWIILPQRLSFDFEEYAGVEPVNILISNAPGNQQQTNVFTLGPTLQFRLADEFRGEADLRLTNSTASVSKDFNSQRSEGAIRAIRDLNPTDVLSANVEVENVHFTDSEGGPDYDRYSAYARYQSKRAQVDLDFALGYSNLDFNNGPGNSGLFTHGKVTWRVTPTSSLEFEFARQYTDASQDLMVDPAALLATTSGQLLVVGTVPITSQVYLERQVGAAYVYQIPRFTLRLAPYYNNYNYSLFPGEDQLIDGTSNQTAHGATLTATYLLRPLWSVGFDAYEETRNYSQIDRRDENVHYGVNLSNQFSRHWSWRADLIHNQRSSTEFGQGFSENIAMLTVTFKR